MTWGLGCSTWCRSFLLYCPVLFCSEFLSCDTFIAGVWLMYTQLSTLWGLGFVWSGHCLCHSGFALVKESHGRWTSVISRIHSTLQNYLEEQFNWAKKRTDILEIVNSKMSNLVNVFWLILYSKCWTITVPFYSYDDLGATQKSNNFKKWYMVCKV